MNKKVGAVISGLSALLLLISKVSPDHFQNLGVDFIFFIASSCKFELCLILLIGLIVIFFENITSAIKKAYQYFDSQYSAFKYYPYFKVLVVQMLFLFIVVNGFYSYKIARARYYFYTVKLYPMFRVKLHEKIYNTAVAGQYERAIEMYNQYFMYFPSLARYNSEDAGRQKELVLRVTTSNSFLRGSEKAVSDSGTIELRKFAYLLRAYGLNPQPETKRRISEILKILNVGIENANKYYAFVKNGNDKEAYQIFLKWNWLFFESGVISDSRQARTSNSNYDKFLFSKELIENVDADDFCYRINQRWMIENANTLLAWVPSKNKPKDTNDFEDNE